MNRTPPSRGWIGLGSIGASSVLALVGASLADGANAAELVLGATSEYNYTSNLLSTEEDPESANSFLFGPTLDFSHEQGRFTYDVEFGGAYQVYVDQSGADAWESRLRAGAAYEIDSRTSVRVTNRFRDVSNLRFSRQDIELADTALDPNQNRYFRNVLELELVRDLTRLVQLSVRGAHHWTDFRENVDRSDSQAFEVGSEARYQVADQHGIGVGATYINQDFQEALSRLGSQSNSITAYLLWNWDIADNIVFTASGGPSFILSEYDDTERVQQNQFVGGRLGGDLFRANIASCGPIGNQVASSCDLDNGRIPAANLGDRTNFDLGPGDQPGEDAVVTAFGAASLRIDLASWNLQATYTRRQSTTSGAGLVSSLDQVYTEAELAPPNQRWSTFVAGSWDRRETLTEAVVVDFTVIDGGPDDDALRFQAFTRNNSGGDRRENLTGIVGVRTAFTRNQAATFEFRYRHTEGSDQGVNQSGAHTYLAVITFAYTLDPIQF